MKFFKDGGFPVVPPMYFIYGAGGTGKTSLVNQFEGKKFVFSFDQSTNPLIGEEDVDGAVLESGDAPTIQATFESYLAKVIGNETYQVIVLDNMTSLQNLVLDNIIGKSKDPRQNYQQMQLWFRNMATALRQSNKTIYATAHETASSNSDLGGKGIYSPDMNDRTFNAFTAPFDLVGRIYVESGKRLIDVDPEMLNHGKNRLDERKNIPAEELIIKQNKKEK